MNRIMITFAVAFFTLAGIAFAQDIVTTTSSAPGETLVDVNGWYALLQPYLEMLLTAVATAATAWITAKLHEWFGIQKESKLRDGLQTTLTNAAGLLMQAVGSKAATMRGIDVHSKFMADAISYVQKAAPDAIAHWNITPASIAEKIEAKLGLLTPVGGAAPVSAEPLLRGGLT